MACKCTHNTGANCYIVCRDQAGMGHPLDKRYLYDADHRKKVLSIAPGLERLISSLSSFLADKEEMVHTKHSSPLSTVGERTRKTVETKGYLLCNRARVYKSIPDEKAPQDLEDRHQVMTGEHHLMLVQMPVVMQVLEVVGQLAGCHLHLQVMQVLEVVGQLAGCHLHLQVLENRSYAFDSYSWQLRRFWLFWGS